MKLHLYDEDVETVVEPQDKWEMQALRILRKKFGDTYIEHYDLDHVNKAVSFDVYMLMRKHKYATLAALFELLNIISNHKHAKVTEE